MITGDITVKGANATIARDTGGPSFRLITVNSASGGGGGGILSNGTLTVKSSTFAGNTAPVNGGAVNVQPSGDVTITDSTIADSTSGSLGGGLSNLGTLTVRRSTIVGNTGSAGGGIATGNLNVFLTKTKIKNNFPDNCSPLNTIPGCTD